MNIEKARWSVKRSNVAGVVPTIPSVSTKYQAGWIDETDIYEGEFFLNTADQVLYTRAGSNIVQVGGTYSVYDELSDLEDVTISATPSNGSGFIFSTASNTWLPSTVLNIDETLRSVYQETCTLGALAANSFAEGFHTEVSGSYAHAEGGGASASGNYSHAEGQNTNAEGDQSHAEGLNTTASGANSHAEGMNNTASGICAHIEGFNGYASGDFSHAEGGGNDATGPYSHAENADNTASGTHSHAQGWHTEATGNRTSTMGMYSVASRNDQMSHGSGDGNEFSYGGAQFCRVISKVQTTDDIATTIYTFNTETNHIYAVRILGLAVVKTGSTVGSVTTYDEGGHYFKNIGGTVSISDGWNHLNGDNDDMLFPGNTDVAVSVSGTDVLLTVAGATSNTINWVLTIEWNETII